MAIGSWRQMPARQGVRQAPPNPPGAPFLTGYTQAQGDQLRKGADSLVSLVSTLGEGDNKRTGNSVRDKAMANRKASGTWGWRARAKPGTWGAKK